MHVLLHPISSVSGLHGCLRYEHLLPRLLLTGHEAPLRLCRRMRRQDTVVVRDCLLLMRGDGAWRVRLEDYHCRVVRMLIRLQ